MKQAAWPQGRLPDTAYNMGPPESQVPVWLGLIRKWNETVANRFPSKLPQNYRRRTIARPHGLPCCNTNVPVGGGANHINLALCRAQVLAPRVSSGMIVSHSHHGVLHVFGLARKRDRSRTWRNCSPRKIWPQDGMSVSRGPCRWAFSR
jgi:hypothetical protein